MINQSGKNTLALLLASDELLLEELFKRVQNYLISQIDWAQQNFVLVLHTIFKFASCKKLLDHCLELICVDPRPLLDSENFSSLDKDILFDLLKRDDLLVEEVDIWDCLIKWGIEQTPGLGSMNSDRAGWNQENFEELKKTLSQFIPLVRFVGISRADFFNRVRPYKTVIPHHIYEEIVEYHYLNTLPKTTTLLPRSGIESKLIKPKLVYIITDWIERKDETRSSRKRKYWFELIYRSSRDWLNTNEFRNKCNNHGPCLVLVKQQSSTKIYGGYNPLNFMHTGGYWYSTSESFIFSFENDNDTTNMQISRIKSSYTNYAIYECCNQCNRGFNFGDTFYMIGKNVILNYSGYYDENVINQSTNYITEEIEEIEVIKVNVS